MRNALVILLLATACHAPSWQRCAGDRFDLVAGDRPVAVYLARANPCKPYLLELRSPAGHQILRDSPADHVHHHALMFGVVANGTNFWEERTQPGREETTAIEADGPILRSTLNWRDARGAALLDERRTVHVTADDEATMLTWRTALSATTAAVTLTGAHYHGLGMRFLPSFDGSATFVHPDGAAGAPVRGSERLTTGAWAACTGSVDGHEVTVVMASHPENQPPARWFTMTTPFAYLSATADGWREPVPIAPGRTLELVYGVLVFDGRPDRERLAAGYARWLAATAPPRCSGERTNPAPDPTSPP